MTHGPWPVDIGPCNAMSSIASRPEVLGPGIFHLPCPAARVSQSQTGKLTPCSHSHKMQTGDDFFPPFNPYARSRTYVWYDYGLTLSRFYAQTISLHARGKVGI
jgi:hypothetical protein